MRLGIVAGEPSGDALAARVIEQLRKRYGQALVVEGVGGEQLIAAGCRSLYPMERLSVMGLIDPLKRLPELLRMRRALVRHFLASPPDAFLGVDAPDFNLVLEQRLRQRGVRTAHLVGPSVWAWRAGRIKRIRRAVDHLFCLFPFEAPIYEQAGVSHEVVGHPMADDLPDVSPLAPARKQLGLNPEGRVVALLPGSRVSEIKAHGPLFLAAAQRLQQRDAGLSFVLPVANAACERALGPLLRDSAVPVETVRGCTRTALAAADAALIASGTATLEAALVKRPMVVAYRTGRVSWALLSRLVKTEFIALPNLLSGHELVPEYLQTDATAEALADALWQQLEDTAAQPALLDAFADIHQSLRRDCATRVAHKLAAMAGDSRA